MTKFLKMDLQTFSGKDSETETKTDETASGGEEEKVETNTEGDPENSAETKTFTQEELDRIIAERLTREQKKRDDAVAAAKAKAEADRLEEEGKYKELAENLQKQLDAQKADALKSKKETLLTKAGYKEEQVELFVNLLTGETDDELNASLDLIKAATPPGKTYADPSAGNGKKKEPEKKGGKDLGQSAYERLKSLGKIRRK